MAKTKAEPKSARRQPKSPRKRSGRTRPAADLRPERTQLKPEPAAPNPLTPKQRAEQLAKLPGWRLAADGRSIACTLSFPAYPLVIVFLNLVTSLAELARYYPEIAVRGMRVTLRLKARTRGGLTAAEFSFADALDGGRELSAPQDLS